MQRGCLWCKQAEWWFYSLHFWSRRLNLDSFLTWVVKKEEGKKNVCVARIWKSTTQGLEPGGSTNTMVWRWAWGQETMRDMYTFFKATTKGREGLIDFYHNCRKSILQHLKRQFWKLDSKLHRHCFQFHQWLIHLHAEGSVPTLQFSTGPSIFLKLWGLFHPSVEGGLLVAKKKFSFGRKNFFFWNLFDG